MLTTEELLQYSRQVILPEVDESGQHRIKAAKVLIVGLGGLGSSCAAYMAAAGVGSLILIDDDMVESSNLQRQIIHQQDTIGLSKVESAKRRLLAINPKLDVKAIKYRADRELVTALTDDFDLIVDCSDNYPTRYLLNELSLKYKKPLIHGSAIKFQGQVTSFNLNEESPCYECLFENKDHNEENCEDQGVFAPIVGVIGSIQASEALKVILKLDSLDGKLHSFDLLNNAIKTFNIAKNPQCNTCSF